MSFSFYLFKFTILFIGIYKKIFNTDEHPRIATTLINIASIHQDLGHYDKALEINQKVYGKKINKLVVMIGDSSFCVFILVS